jgi:chaperonin GroES
MTKRYWQPAQDRVLLAPVEPESITASGIIIPVGYQQKTFQGIVAAVGPGRYENGIFVETTVKPGDIVLYSKYGGHEIKVDGREMVILRENEILAVEQRYESEGEEQTSE